MSVKGDLKESFFTIFGRVLRIFKTGIQLYHTAILITLTFCLVHYMFIPNNNLTNIYFRSISMIIQVLFFINIFVLVLLTSIAAYTLKKKKIKTIILVINFLGAAIAICFLEPSVNIVISDFLRIILSSFDNRISYSITLLITQVLALLIIGLFSNQHIKWSSETYYTYGSLYLTIQLLYIATLLLPIWLPYSILALLCVMIALVIVVLVYKATKKRTQKVTQEEKIDFFYGVGKLLSTPFNKVAYAYHTAIMVAIILSLFKTLLKGCPQQLAAYLDLFLMIYYCWLIIVIVLSSILYKIAIERKNIFILIYYHNENEAKKIYQLIKRAGITAVIVVIVLTIVIVALPAFENTFTETLLLSMPLLRNSYIEKGLLFGFIAFCNILPLLLISYVEIGHNKTIDLRIAGAFYIGLQVLAILLLLIPLYPLTFAIIFAIVAIVVVLCLNRLVSSYS